MTPRKGVLLLLFLLVLAGGSPVRAQEGGITRRAGLPSDGVTALAWGEGALWVGTVQGLGRWADGRARTVPLPLDELHILALHHDGAALWVGTANGIARREGEAWQTWQRGDAGLGNGWATSFAGHQGALAVGTYGGGVYRWEGGAWQPLGGSPAQVSTLASDGERLWAGTPRGLWRGEGGAWQPEPLPVPNAAVRALLVTEGAIWAGSEAGLFRRERAGAALWQPTAIQEGVASLAGVPGGVVAATPRGLLDGASGEPIPGPLAAISALLPTPAGLAVGTLGQGVWLAGRIAVEVPPALPVVLLHGLGDSNEVSDSQLRFLRHWLEQDGHPVALAPYDEAAPLLDNVASVRRTVAALRKETGQAQVILIAHSLGGLVARGYLASGASEVAGLVTLGTPHAGVRLVYDFLVTDLPTDAAPHLRELLPEHAALIAPFAEGGAVPQLHVGGNLLPQGNLFEGFPPHDGIITAASATAAPGATRLTPLLHGWTLATMQQGLPSLLWPEALYLNTLRPWLQSLSDSPWRDRAEPLPLPPAGFAQRPLFTQPLAPGESATVSVPLDGQPATWLLEGSGVAMELLAPDGTRYPSDRFLLGERVAHLPYRESIFQPLDLWSTRALPGLWQARLTNEGGDPAETRLVLVEPRRPALALALVEPWVAPGGTVTVDGQGPSGLALTVTLGTAQARLVEGSPGIYRASLPAPTRPGYHALRVADTEIERWAVVGVRSEAWAVEQATLTGTAGRPALRLALVGEGKVALGLRLLRGDELLATRLVGPFRFPTGGPHTLTQPLPALPSLDGVRLEWQLFDARGALVPITGMERVGE